MLVILPFPAETRSVSPLYPNQSAPWFARGIWRLGAQPSVVFLAPDGYEPSLFNELASGCDVIRPFRHHRLNLFDGITECIEEAAPQSSEIAIASCASVGAPQGCLDILLQRHRATQAWMSMVKGLPPGVSPIIVSRSLLEVAKQVTAIVAEADVTNGVETFFRQCVSVAQRTGQESATICELKLSEIAAYDPTSLPRTFDLNDAYEMRRLSRITDDFADHQSNYGLQLLEAWKTSLIEEVRARRRVGISRQNETRRVLYISYASGYTGASEALCEMIGRLPRERYLPYALLGRHGYFAERLAKRGVEVRLPEYNVGSVGASADGVHRVLASVKPDLVHVNDHSGSELPIVCHSFGVPVIYHARTIMHSAGMVQMLESCEGIITVSEYVRRQILHYDIPEERVYVVYDGVDTERFSVVSEGERREAKRALGVPLDKCVVLMVARYAWNKRHDVLIKAIDKMENRDAVTVILVGESFGDVRCERATDRLLSETGVGRNTIKLGFQRDVRPIINAADVCVLCSEMEPLGTFILEAMSSGLPVIVTSDGGLQELVADRGGIVVPPGDPDILCEALERVVRDKSLRAMLGAAAREVCLTRCSLALCASGVAGVYEKVLAEC